MRKLIIFGNGLGRSLDNEFFSLSTALEDAWNDESILNEADKLLIRQCLPENVIEPDGLAVPTSENELGNLQRVLAACDEIQKHQLRDTEGWLTDHGVRFPHAIRSFVHRTATYFHSGDHMLPNTFTEPLLEFIGDSRSHIATLNYDELLYRAFVGSSIFSGYSCLIDGFVRTFSAENLSRRSPSRQSYYLHLHGSPLYYLGTDNELHKSALSNLRNIQGHSSTHIVLTHTDFKPAVINTSLILRTYWEKLYEALQEVDAVVLVGYSGEDRHLNAAISFYASGKQIEIVEREQEKHQDDPRGQKRFLFWKSKLGNPVLIYWYNSILEHNFWNYVKTD